MDYEYGIDHFIRAHRTITPDTEREADAIFQHAEERGKLPDNYIVKAVVRCNQVDTFRMAACDWNVTIEYRAPFIEEQAKARIAAHLRNAHPYLSTQQIRNLLAVTHYNFRDFGR